VTSSPRALCALWLAPTLVLAAPQLPESARWGGEGELRWETPDALHVLGKAGPSNPCGFEVGRTVVEAVWEGNVLVGTVQLCLAGSSCPAGGLDYFAIYNTSDGTLVADLLLPEGCSSPGLDGRRLVLGPRAKLRANLSHHIALGTQALEERRGKAARSEFELALEAKEDPGPCYLGLGMAAVLLGENDAAIEAYKKALRYRTEGVVLYQLACAEARKGDLEESFNVLDDAMKHGFADPDDMVHDPDLQTLQTQDASRFAALLKRARANAAHRPARASGRGAP